MKDGLKELQRDLRRFAREFEENVGKDVVKGVFGEIVTAPDFPIDSGKLRAGGSAFWQGQLIATSADFGIVHPEATPVEKCPIPPNANSGVIVFSAKKPAGQFGFQFYTDGGKRYFDYSFYVHEIYQKKYVDSFVNAATIDPIIKRHLDEAWRKAMR